MSFFPKTVSIVLTEYCNLKCLTCWSFSPLNQWNSNQKKNLTSIDFPLLEQILEDLAALKTSRVTFTGGGDPLLYSKFDQAVQLVKRLSLKVTLISNLTLINDIEKFCDLKIDAISANFSCADEESYREFHGNKNIQSYAKLMKNLEMIACSSTKLKLVFVVCSINYHLLLPLVNIAADLQASLQIKLMGSNTFTEKIAVNLEQKQFLFDQKEQLFQLANKLKVEHNFHSFYSQLSGKTSREFPIEEIGCYAGKIYARIDADAQLRYCCNPNEKLTIGSLRKHRFKELWQGERYNALRNSFADNIFVEGCQYCGKYQMNLDYRAKRQL